MAHDLMVDPITGEAAMFFYGALPWHGLGQELVAQRPATAEEAIRLAHLDWEVKKYPALVQLEGKTTAAPGWYGTVRQDTIGYPNPVVLGIVGPNYTPLQNIEAFGFFDSVVGSGQAIYHTAGALRQGDRIWILAKLPEDIKVLGQDVTEQYLLLSNSHDGTSSIVAMFTPVRVVCKNTLAMAFNSNTRQVKIRHTASAQERLSTAARLMGIISQQSQETAAVYDDMARFKLNGQRLLKYFGEIYPAPAPKADAKDGDADKAAENYKLRLKTLVRLFEAGPGHDMPGIGGTLWMAYNAVTDYVDHYSRGKDAERRMDSVMFGAGAKIKADALEFATAKRDVWA